MMELDRFCHLQMGQFALAAAGFFLTPDTFASASGASESTIMAWGFLFVILALHWWSLSKCADIMEMRKCVQYASTGFFLTLVAGAMEMYDGKDLSEWAIGSCTWALVNYSMTLALIYNYHPKMWNTSYNENTSEYTWYHRFRYIPLAAWAIAPFVDYDWCIAQAAWPFAGGNAFMVRSGAALVFMHAGFHIAASQVDADCQRNVIGSDLVSVLMYFFIAFPKYAPSYIAGNSGINLDNIGLPSISGMQYVQIRTVMALTAIIWATCSLYNKELRATVVRISYILFAWCACQAVFAPGYMATLLQINASYCDHVSAGYFGTLAALFYAAGRRDADVTNLLLFWNSVAIIALNVGTYVLESVDLGILGYMLTILSIASVIDMVNTGDYLSSADVKDLVMSVINWVTFDVMTKSSSSSKSTASKGMKRGSTPMMKKKK